jgi:hypothetical protein
MYTFPLPSHNSSFITGLTAASSAIGLTAAAAGSLTKLFVIAGRDILLGTADGATAEELILGIPFAGLTAVTAGAAVTAAVVAAGAVVAVGAAVTAGSTAVVAAGAAVAVAALVDFEPILGRPFTGLTAVAGLADAADNVLNTAS